MDVNYIILISLHHFFVTAQTAQKLAESKKSVITLKPQIRFFHEQAC